MDTLITINENNLNLYIKHGYEIILNTKLNNWDITTINAMKEQCKSDNKIFYDHPDRNIRQIIINSWLIDLTKFNNINNVTNLAIEFRYKTRSESYYFYIDLLPIINNQELLKLTIYCED